MMRAETPAELLTALRWAHVPLLFWLVSIVWFVRIYLGPGGSGSPGPVRPARVLPGAHVPAGANVLYREITSLRHVPFLGESVTVFTVITNSMDARRPGDNLLILFFVADASVTAWRRGERRKALMVGGSVEFFLILGMLESCADLLGTSSHPDSPQPVLPGHGRGDGVRVEP